MKCPYCQNKIGKNAAFCPSCGAALNTGAATTEKRKKPVWKWILLVLAALILVYAASYGVWYLITFSKVPEEKLTRLVESCQSKVEDLEEYYDTIIRVEAEGGTPAMDHVDRKIWEQQIIRGSVYASSPYREASQYRNWDEYQDYEDLYNATCALDELFDEYFSNGDVDSFMSRYDLLMEEYQRCLEKVT